MYSQIPTPTHRLSKNIKKVFFIQELIHFLISAFIFGLLFYLDSRFQWVSWIRWVLLGLAFITLFFTIWSMLIKPMLLYKNFRYAVNAEFLQIKRGAWNEHHELVPMTKIQAVGTNQGPILRKYGLVSVGIETTGSFHSIPALEKNIAIELRNQIAFLAKIKEVES